MQHDAQQWNGFDAPPVELERRAAARVAVDWSVKLAPAEGGVRYLAGRVCDVCVDGARIEVEGRRGLGSGERVRLGFADATGPGVLSTERMIEATVLRRLGAGDRQTIALRFAEPLATESLAADAAAGTPIASSGTRQPVQSPARPHAGLQRGAA